MHHRARKEEIFWAEQNETAFPLKWKWSTERRGATLSKLSATATNDVAGPAGVQLNMQRRRSNGCVTRHGGGQFRHSRALLFSAPLPLREDVYERVENYQVRGYKGHW